MGLWPRSGRFWAVISVTLSEEPVASKVAVPGVTYQRPRFWLKAVAPLNVLRMSVTEETSQPDMSWLKAEAPRNIPPMLVTLETAQSLRGWLKARAS